MKLFNRLKNQDTIYQKTFPTGTFFGKINLTYSYKKPTGKTVQMFNKDGYPIFNKNGTPKTRPVFKITTEKKLVVYAITDLQPVIMKDGAAYFRAFISTDNNQKFHETVLCRNAWMKELNIFLHKKLQEYCVENNTTMSNLWLECGLVHTSNRAKRHLAEKAAHRREVQRDYLFRGFGLNSSIINEEVRFAPDGASIKGVFARHKDAFGVKAVNDPKKDAPEPLEHGFVCVNGKNSRVVYPTAKMAIAANHVYKHGKGDDAGTCLDAAKIMAVRKI